MEREEIRDRQTGRQARCAFQKRRKSQKGRDQKQGERTGGRQQEGCFGGAFFAESWWQRGEERGATATKEGREVEERATAVRGGVREERGAHSRGAKGERQQRRGSRELWGKERQTFARKKRCKYSGRV